MGNVATSPLDVQVGGDHYKKMKIQPFEFVHGNNIGFAEGSIIYYVARWRDKGGVQDLKKARHFLDMLIEAEEANEKKEAEANMVGAQNIMRYGLYGITPDTPNVDPLAMQAKT